MVEITAFRLENKSCEGFFLNKFSTNESAWIITGHVTYNPAYTYKFQLNTICVLPVWTLMLYVLSKRNKSKTYVVPSYIQANGMVLEAKLSPMKVFYKVLFEKFKKNVGLKLNQVSFIACQKSWVSGHRDGVVCCFFAIQQQKRFCSIKFWANLQC